MELTGKCIAVLPARSGVSAKNGNPWTSQEYVIEVPGQYPKKMVFTIFGEDRIKQFNIQLGFTYNVAFDIDAHEHQGRWFNSINAYNVTCMDVVQPHPQEAVATQPTQPAQQTDSNNKPSDTDNLPF